MSVSESSFDPLTEFFSEHVNSQFNFPSKRCDNNENGSFGSSICEKKGKFAEIYMETNKNASRQEEPQKPLEGKRPWTRRCRFFLKSRDSGNSFDLFIRRTLDLNSSNKEFKSCNEYTSSRHCPQE
jgi:hypothetical protein